MNRFERRVAGVLVEKSKTTPDTYPMTLNSIVTGSNQKSNRYPLMTLTPDQAQDALDGLREMGAVIVVHGDGRVPKFKHQLYEWLGVNKVEMAIMGELLLRGQQTLGDLRARASRMEPLPTQEVLRPLIQSLIDKGLLLELTPAGRGQVVTHNLYHPEELTKVRSQLGSMISDSSTTDSSARDWNEDDSTGSPDVEAPSSENIQVSAVPQGELQLRLEKLEQKLASALARIQAIENALQ